MTKWGRRAFALAYLFFGAALGVAGCALATGISGTTLAVQWSLIATGALCLFVAAVVCA